MIIFSKLLKTSLDSIKVGWDTPKKKFNHFELTLLDETGQIEIRKLKLLPIKVAQRIENLNPATWYQVRIQVLSGRFRSPSRTIKVSTELDRPKDVSVDPDETTVNVFWKASKAHTVITLINEFDKTRKFISAEPGQSEKMIRNLSPGTEYTIQLQHNQNRIFSEYNDIKVTTSISYATPAINIAYLTDAKALFNWDDSNFKDGDFEYVFSWKKDGKV